ncbi:uncharacterized protein LOC124436755 [Xenia sp. Carnegie-2017]|uniref:uncharacterized protein LOC124436755 n=1 Tax=Xenia sp. Carnegie-2017 TaxID=2897299 RepID=UPI001F03AA68|nr:uncharacterized protein LOC124436755 [Xenia sp. Carnegie-2017]
MVAGELISSSLAQGGPAPCFLAKNVFNYVAEGVNSIQANNWLELVHDANFKDEIDKLVKCESDEELRTLHCSDDMMNILQSMWLQGCSLQGEIGLTRQHYSVDCNCRNWPYAGSDGQIKNWSYTFWGSAANSTSPADNGINAYTGWCC